MIKLVWPSDPKGYINSGFGKRKPPGGIGSSDHRGVDIATAGYALAAADGTVTIGGYNKARGYYLTVNHGGGIVTLYQHLKEGGYLVRNGQTVKAGQRLGKCGATGNATGVHLHFEVHINGTPVDPEPYLKGAAVVSGFGSILSVGTGIVSATEASQEAVAVVHVPQVEKVYTKYEADVYTKKEDEYRVTWQSMDTGQIRDITDRCEAPELTDDADSLCVELSLSVRQGGGDYYMKPLILAPGDFVAVTNVASEEVVFVGQVQTVDGSYQSALRCRCLDGGRLLTANECIIQFNNIPAKEALSQLANKVGISGILVPELISSVYGIYRDSAAAIAQSILETIRGENGVRYFLRMVGETLTVRSFASEPIELWYRQANNLDSFDVFNEAAEPQLSWSIEELRNHITLYSGDDTGTVIQAELSDEESVKRYGKRMAVENWTQDKAKISAADRAKVALWEKNRVTESFTIETYGSDRAVAGALVYVRTAEVQGYFWITAVRHHYGTPHRMTMTLVRSDYTPAGALSDDMGEALMET